MDITVYTLEDANGQPVNDTWSTMDYREARDAGENWQARVIANEYEFSDSHMVDDFTPEPGFHIRVGVAGRLFCITPLDTFPASGDDWIPVDCRDVRSTMESQAIVEASVAADRGALLADPQVRDAIRSAYLNATSHESGQYPGGGVILDDPFRIEFV